MGRTAKKPAAPAAEVILNEGALQALDASVEQMRQVKAAYDDDRDLMNQLLGQAQMADAFAKFSKTVLTSKLAFVKEKKLYQQLSGKKTQDGLEFSGTWAEFCSLIGWTAEHANESIANLRQFGEEALEGMSKMGIGYRELRQYRKLPEDQKQALIEVAKAGDKEGFVELAEEMIAKSVKEKEALQKQLQDTKDQADELAADKKDLEVKVSALRKEAKRLEQSAPDEVEAHLYAQAQEVAGDIEARISGALRHGLEQLIAHGEETGHTQRARVKGQLDSILDRLNTVARRMGIELDTGVPKWLNPSAFQAAATDSTH